MSPKHISVTCSCKAELPQGQRSSAWMRPLDREGLASKAVPSGTQTLLTAGLSKLFPPKMQWHKRKMQCAWNREWETLIWGRKREKPHSWKVCCIHEVWAQHCQKSRIQRQGHVCAWQRSTACPWAWNRYEFISAQPVLLPGPSHPSSGALHGVTAASSPSCSRSLSRYLLGNSFTAVASFGPG